VIHVRHVAAAIAFTGAVIVSAAVLAEDSSPGGFKCVPHCTIDLKCTCTDTGTWDKGVDKKLPKKAAITTTPGGRHGPQHFGGGEVLRKRH
jgi:hypothetical protein